MKKQLEIDWGTAEPFGLIPQQTQDGERLQAEANQRTEDHHQSTRVQWWFKQMHTAVDQSADPQLETGNEKTET